MLEYVAVFFIGLLFLYLAEKNRNIRFVIVLDIAWIGCLFYVLWRLILNGF